MSSTQEKVWKAIYNTYIIVKDVNALTLGCQEYGLLKFLMDDTNSTRQACWGPQTAEASDSPSWLAFRDSEFASLWAPLVTRTLARGIRNGDSPIGRRKKISGDTPIWKIILPKTSKRNENIVSVHQPRGKNVRQLTNTKKKKKNGDGPGRRHGTGFTGHDSRQTNARVIVRAVRESEPPHGESGRAAPGSGDPPSTACVYFRKNRPRSHTATEVSGRAFIWQHVATLISLATIYLFRS